MLTITSIRRLTLGKKNKKQRNCTMCSGARSVSALRSIISLQCGQIRHNLCEVFHKTCAVSHKLLFLQTICAVPTFHTQSLRDLPQNLCSHTNRWSRTYLRRVFSVGNLCRENQMAEHLVAGKSPP